MERERERFEEVERDFAYKLQTELKEREREILEGGIQKVPLPLIRCDLQKKNRCLRMLFFTFDVGGKRVWWRKEENKRPTDGVN